MHQIGSTILFSHKFTIPVCIKPYDFFLICYWHGSRWLALGAVVFFHRSPHPSAIAAVCELTFPLPLSSRSSVLLLLHCLTRRTITELSGIPSVAGSFHLFPKRFLYLKRAKTIPVTMAYNEGPKSVFHDATCSKTEYCSSDQLVSQLSQLHMLLFFRFRKQQVMGRWRKRREGRATYIGQTRWKLLEATDVTMCVWRQLYIC